MALAGDADELKQNPLLTTPKFSCESNEYPPSTIRDIQSCCKLDLSEIDNSFGLQTTPSEEEGFRIKNGISPLIPATLTYESKTSSGLPAHIAEDIEDEKLFHENTLTDHHCSLVHEIETARKQLIPRLQQNNNQLCSELTSTRQELAISQQELLVCQKQLKLYMTEMIELIKENNSLKNIPNKIDDKNVANETHPSSSWHDDNNSNLSNRAISKTDMIQKQKRRRHTLHGVPGLLLSPKHHRSNIDLQAKKIKHDILNKNNEQSSNKIKESNRRVSFQPPVKRPPNQPLCESQVESRAEESGAYSGSSYSGSSYTSSFSSQDSSDDFDLSDCLIGGSDEEEDGTTKEEGTTIPEKEERGECSQVINHDFVTVEQEGEMEGSQVIFKEINAVGDGKKEEANFVEEDTVACVLVSSMTAEEGPIELDICPIAKQSIGNHRECIQETEQHLIHKDHKISDVNDSLGGFIDLETAERSIIEDALEGINIPSNTSSTALTTDEKDINERGGVEDESTPKQQDKKTDSELKETEIKETHEQIKNKQPDNDNAKEEEEEDNKKLNKDEVFHVNEVVWFCDPMYQPPKLLLRDDKDQTEEEEDKNDLKIIDLITSSLSKWPAKIIRQKGHVLLKPDMIEIELFPLKWAGSKPVNSSLIIKWDDHSDERMKEQISELMLSSLPSSSLSLSDNNNPKKIKNNQTSLLNSFNNGSKRSNKRLEAVKEAKKAIIEKQELSKPFSGFHFISLGQQRKNLQSKKKEQELLNKNLSNKNTLLSRPSNSKSSSLLDSTNPPISSSRISSTVTIVKEKTSTDKKTDKKNDSSMIKNNIFLLNDKELLIQTKKKNPMKTELNLNQKIIIENKKEEEGMKVENKVSQLAKENLKENSMNSSPSSTSLNHISLNQNSENIEQKKDDIKENSFEKLKKLKEIERQLGWDPSAIVTPSTSSSRKDVKKMTTSSFSSLNTVNASITTSSDSIGMIQVSKSNTCMGTANNSSLSSSSVPSNSLNNTSSSEIKSEKIQQLRAGVRATGVFASKTVSTKVVPISRFPSPRLEKHHKETTTTTIMRMTSTKTEKKTKEEEEKVIIKPMNNVIDKVNADDINVNDESKLLRIEPMTGNTMKSSSISTSTLKSQPQTQKLNNEQLKQNVISKHRRKSVCPEVTDLDLSTDFGSDLSDLSLEQDKQPLLKNNNKNDTFEKEEQEPTRSYQPIKAVVNNENIGVISKKPGLKPGEISSLRKAVLSPNQANINSK